MRTSYSALETYRTCPQKYKFQVVDRLPAKKSKAALFGTHIHGALRFMFSQDPLFPTLDEVLNYFCSEFPPEDKFPVADGEKQLYLDEGERMLKNFYAKNAPWNFSVVELEQYFEVLLEDRRNKETHVLAGRIDRIDKTASGYEVIDYKTSRRIPSQEAVDRDLQMSIYGLGIRKRWPHVDPDEITLSLYFLKHGEKLSTSRTADAMEVTANGVLRTIGEIDEKLRKNDRFLPNPGPQCAMCPYKPLCPAWRHLYRKEETGNRKQGEIEMLLKEYFEILKGARGSAKRLAELKTEIAAYMDAEGYDRLFAEEGSLSRVLQKRYAYDFEKVRAILEPLGKWEEIIAADERKLKLLLKTVSLEVRSEIEAARVLAREFIVMSASMKRIQKPEAPDSTPEK